MYSPLPEIYNPLFPPPHSFIHDAMGFRNTLSVVTITLIIFHEGTTGKERNALLESKIVNGKTATPHEFPWLISLRHSGYPQCGGTILNNFYIVTTAHCVVDVNKDTLLVTAGDHDLRCWEGTEQTAGVSDIWIHEEYNRVMKWNDIAIVRVDPPFNFGYPEYVSPLTLPTKDFKYPKVATMPGWGALKHKKNGSMGVPVLRKVVDMPYATYEECVIGKEKYLRNDTQVCYGNDDYDRDACQGDSGGGLVCMAEYNEKVLCGIMVWGIRCAVRGSPGVYLKVTEYIDWIEARKSLAFPFVPTLQKCNGYWNMTSSAMFNFTNLHYRSQCTWVIETRNEDMIFKVVSKVVNPDDEVFFTTPDKIRNGGVPVKYTAAGYPNTFQFTGVTYMIMSVRMANSVFPANRHIAIRYESEGFRKSRTRLVTDMQSLREHMDNITYPIYSEYYANNRFALFVLNGPVPTSPSPSYRVRFEMMDIGRENPLCMGDELAFLQLGTDGIYKEKGSHCGQGPYSDLVIPADGLVIVRFTSGDFSRFGKGFRIHYEILI